MSRRNTTFLNGYQLAAVWCAIAAIGTFSGCAAGITTIEMDPLEFQAISTPNGIRVEAMDPEMLFEQGSSAFENGDFVEAARIFGVVSSRFPDSEQGGPALFNLGLSSLRAGRPADAATAFKSYMERFPDQDDDIQVRLRLAEALLESGEWAGAERIIQTSLTRPGMTPAAEIEFRAGLTRALRKLDRLQEALDQSRAALGIFDSHAVEPEMRANYSAAMAAFEGGEIWHDLFLSIKLVLPKDRMEKDLTDKATILLKAQGEYMRTVRVGNVFWASRAGIRIGQLYEEFYDDIMNAEVPPGLNENDLGRYMDELRHQARPLLEKAVTLYERNMEVCRRFGAREEWFSEMKERLTRLKSLLGQLSGNQIPGRTP